MAWLHDLPYDQRVSELTIRFYWGDTHRTEAENP